MTSSNKVEWIVLYKSMWNLVWQGGLHVCYSMPNFTFSAEICVHGSKLKIWHFCQYDLVYSVIYLAWFLWCHPGLWNINLNHRKAWKEIFKISSASKSLQYLQDILKHGRPNQHWSLVNVVVYLLIKYDCECFYVFCKCCIVMTHCLWCLVVSVTRWHVCLFVSRTIENVRVDFLEVWGIKEKNWLNFGRLG